MRFAFDEAQEELRSAARAFLADHSSGDQVRKAMASEHGFDAAVWERIGAELGWPSVIVPEAYGGVGLGHVELVGLMEEMGYALLCAPFFSSVCLAANALLLAGDEAQKQTWLPRIAEGELIATLAFAERGGEPGPAGMHATWRPGPGGYVLSGSKRYVIDGARADLIVVAARADGSRGQDGVSLFAVPGDAEGLERRPRVTMDQTRRQAEIELRDVHVSADACLGEPGLAWSALQETLDLAAIALAAEQVGGAQRCLDLSVEYAKQRQQFGRPIGSFQAIKHKCANMLLQVESARSAAYYAGWVAAEQPRAIPEHASLARAYCSEAFFACAAESIQIHGGVGFTWEYDPHLYLKRARASEGLLGTPAWHRERVAHHIGLIHEP